MKTWIVVVNRCEAKVFEADGRHNKGEVRYVEKLENPRGRLRDSDINSDRPGFIASPNHHGGRMAKPQSPTERIAQMFAKKVTMHLEDACRQNAFDELVLIAPPNFLGQMRAMFSRELREKVEREMPKDLGPAVTGDELKERLWPRHEEQITL